MKKSIRFLLGLVLVLAVAGSAGATQYTDTHDPDNIYMSSHVFSPDDIHTWTFDIRDSGFDPDAQDVTSAYIDIFLYDDDICGHKEKIEVYFDQSDDEGDADWHQWTWTPGDFTITIESLITLSDFGTLELALKADAGDFYFDKAILTAQATDPVVPVPNPEPATMMLFGLGLLGLAGIGRKQS